MCHRDAGRCSRSKKRHHYFRLHNDLGWFSHRCHMPFGCSLKPAAIIEHTARSIDASPRQLIIEALKSSTFLEDLTMAVQTTSELVHKKCKPCEGGVKPYSPEEAREQLKQLTGWRMTHDGQRIRKEWKVKNFMAG